MAQPTDPLEESLVVSNPFASRSQPERLAVIGVMRGLRPAPAERARLLEIGCATGLNLLALAERYPQSTFLGIESSSAPVAVAQASAAALGLKNVEFRLLDFSDAAEEWGTFDYIISQDVYSRSAHFCRDQLLAFCRQHLAPQGIAALGYATYPAWHVHDMFRCMMRYDSRGADGHTEQISRARTLLEFLNRSLVQDEPYDLLVKSELALLLKRDDAYLLQTYFGDASRAVNFEQFLAQASSHELQFIGDAAIGLAMYDSLEPQLENDLANLTNLPARKERLRDVVRNRAFRQTLLCHGGLTLSAACGATQMAPLHLEAHVTPENSGFDPRSSATDHFITASGGRISTGAPLLRAALAHLSEQWPSYTRWEDLLSAARQRIAHSGMATPSQLDMMRLEDSLLQCCLAQLIDVHSHSNLFCAHRSERPVASPFARWQAAGGNVVTSRRHESVRLDDLDRQILSLLDGTRGPSQIAEELSSAVGQGRLTMWEQGQAVQDPQRVAGALLARLPQNLSRFAQLALLIG